MATKAQDELEQKAQNELKAKSHEQKLATGETTSHAQKLTVTKYSHQNASADAQWWNSEVIKSHFKLQVPHQ